MEGVRKKGKNYPQFFEQVYKRSSFLGKIIENSMYVSIYPQKTKN